MAVTHSQTDVAAHLTAALDTEDHAEKNYHIRQALQLLNITETAD